MAIGEVHNSSIRVNKDAIQTATPKVEYQLRVTNPSSRVTSDNSNSNLLRGILIRASRASTRNQG